MKKLVILTAVVSTLSLGVIGLASANTSNASFKIQNNTLRPIQAISNGSVLLTVAPMNNKILTMPYQSFNLVTVKKSKSCYISWDGLKFTVASASQGISCKMVMTDGVRVLKYSSK